MRLRDQLAVRKDQEDHELALRLLLEAALVSLPATTFEPRCRPAQSSTRAAGEDALKRNGPFWPEAVMAARHHHRRN